MPESDFWSAFDRLNKVITKIFIINFGRQWTERLDVFYTKYEATYSNAKNKAALMYLNYTVVSLLVFLFEE